MRLAITTSIALLVLAAVGAGAAQGAANVRHCGNIGLTGPQNIRAVHVKCKPARHLARVHQSSCDLRNKVCYIGPYRCSRKFFGNSGTRVRCTDDRRVVRFFYGT